MARSMGAMGWSPARRNVVALFAEMAGARAAIDALEAQGIGAGATRVVRRRVVAGTAIGGVLGLGIAVLIVAFTAGAEPITLLLAAVAGAVGGGSIGMMLAGVGAPDVTPDWELTFERDRAGRIMVAVGSEDQETAQEAVDVLHDHDPIRVEQLDANGRRL